MPIGQLRAWLGLAWLGLAYALGQSARRAFFPMAWLGLVPLAGAPDIFIFSFRGALGAGAFWEGKTPLL